MKRLIIFLFGLFVFSNCYSQQADTARYLIDGKYYTQQQLDSIQARLIQLKKNEAEFVSEKDISLKDTISEKYVYALLMGYGNPLSFKVKIEIDYGQAVDYWSWNNQKILRDETGKAIKFNSMVDAMNYMGSLGWEFVQAYAYSVPGVLGTQMVYHYLFKQKVKNQ